MLWEIVLADGVLHEFESNLVWRASELLGVSTQDRVRLEEARREPGLVIQGQTVIPQTDARSSRAMTRVIGRRSSRPFCLLIQHEDQP